MTATVGSPQAAPRVLLFSMYPLDRGLWGATTRITQLRDALARRVQLDVISGTRAGRAIAMARFVASRRLGGLAGIYVENSTALPGPADLLFLAIARTRRIPILTYVRDAQQLFPEYYRTTSLKRHLSRALFLPAVRLLMAISTIVAFPSAGLAAAVVRNRRPTVEPTLLPPGSRIASASPVDPAARGILFVGALSYAVHGAAILLDAMRLARASDHQLTLICVSRPGDEPSGPLPSWLRVVRAEGEEIDALLPQVLATITPRRRSPYNDLAVPIKVMEYLGYARPMIVTDTLETAAIVRGAECGVIVPDTAEGLADGIRTVASASPDQIRLWAEAARRAAVTNSWDVRAATILDLLRVNT